MNDHAGVEACAFHVAAFKRAFNFCAAPLDVGLRDLLHEKKDRPRLHPPEAVQSQGGSKEKGPERIAPSLHY
jgi:hypothetical protein